MLHAELHGDGEPLCLLHGFSGAGGALDLDDFGSRWRVIRPDLRGHGRSENPAPGFTHRDSAEDILALADHLGVASFRAVGLSAGANTLLHVATRAPERVQAMVRVSATTHFPEPARAIMRTIREDGSSLWVVPGGGHVPVFGPERPAFEQAVRAFLEKS